MFIMLFMKGFNEKERRQSDVSLGKYEVFVTVIESGSLTKAGEMLGLTQSAISHALASLEREFGFSILTRGAPVSA